MGSNDMSLASASSSSSSSQAASVPRGPRLRIVCVNDVYSLESLPRLRNLVRHYAETAPADRFLVTLAGDFNQLTIDLSVDGLSAHFSATRTRPESGETTTRSESEYLSPM